jgi:sugar/nucleoside kinase (ribokinase family)
MTRVIVVGDLMADVIATVSSPLAHASDTPARIVSRPGGGGANVAVRLVEAGVPTLLVARVGEDAPGQAAIAELRAAGVELEIAIDAQRSTGACVVIVEPGGERTMLPDRGANAALEPADLPIDEFTEGRHLHLSGYTLLDPGSRPAGLVALEHARAAGMTISVDPASAAPLQELGPHAFLGWTRRAGLLLPNLEEAAVLTGARDPEAAAWALAKDGREVVITLGKEGALWSDGERVVRARASPAPARVDSTGAGDAFTAGWLAARLQGEEPSEALAAANFAAAQVLKDAGAR